MIQLHQSGQRDEARKHYEDYLSQNPKDTDILHLLTILHLQNKEVSSALSCSERLYELDSEDANYLVVYANCLSYSNQNKRAIELYEQALSKADNPSHVYNMKGNHYYRLESYQLAQDCYQLAIELNSNLHEARFNYALTLIQQKLFTEALIELEQLVSQFNLIQYRIQLAQLYHQLERIDQAKEQYHKILNIDASHAMTHHRLASIYLADNDSYLAKRHYKKVIESDPTHSETLHNLASIYLNEKKYQEALMYWHKQVESSPDATAFYNLGICYYYLNRFDDANVFLTHCLDYDPDYINAYLNLANVALRQKKPEAAVGYYKQIVSRQPDHDEAHYLLASLNGLKHEYKQSPSAYVNRLFDQYAEYYNKHLTDMLDYRVPEYLYESVESSVSLDSPNRFPVVLDLGCGTGLAGELFHAYGSRLIGVDLSSAMLKKAKSLKIYDDLVSSDVIDYLGDKKNLADLILMADMLPYMGDLSTLVECLVNSMNDRALLVFSVELLTDSSKDYLLQKSARFAHNPSYIDRLFKSRLIKVSENKRVLRRQNDQDIYGMVYLYKKTL